MLKRTVPDAARYCGRALAMPNLDPPIGTVAQAIQYRKEILAAVPKGQHFEPVMTIYLRAQTDPKQVRLAADSGVVRAFKLYPARTTTGSEAGVSRMEDIDPVLEQMQKHGVILAVHAESPDPEIDVFDREAHFLEHHLSRIIKKFPELKIVVEHISTVTAVDFVRACASTVAATITAHHLCYQRNDLLAGNLRPHYYCAPILKRDADRTALREAATSGEPKFFLGTDSAPHQREEKLSACGCAGCYTALSALCDYAQVFEDHQALEHLELFASCAGADFYGVPRNADTITLRKTPWQIPDTLTFDGLTIVPLGAGEKRDWQITPSDMV